MKPCIATPLGGPDLEFSSILEAARWVEDRIKTEGKPVPKGGAAPNICRALKKGKTAYGLAWRHKE